MESYKEYEVIDQFRKYKALARTLYELVDDNNINYTDIDLEEKEKELEEIGHIEIGSVKIYKNKEEN